MSAIRFDIADHVATILIDNPTRRNALDRQDVVDLRQALDKVVLATSGVRVVVIGGAGDVFCSGLNLRRMVPTAHGMAEQEGELKRMHFHSLVLRLDEIRVPTIAAVNGPAVGAGMSLAIACTMAVMSRNAYLESSIARIGLVPDGGLTYHLPRRVGPAQAARILLTGERIDADQALRLGLAAQVVEPGAALDEALHLARRIASLPARATALTHALLRESAGHTLAAQLNEERKAQDIMIASADCKEGVSAFFAKRAPVFNRGAEA